MKKKPVIRISNLNKTFKIHTDKKYSLRQLFSSFLRQGNVVKFKALNNIDLEIVPGEFIGIIGRNGSGKSTLLKIISGIYQGDQGGKVKVFGKVVPFLELGVGFNPELTGKENIYLNGTILGMTKNFIDKNLQEIIDFSELAQFIDEPVKNYSSGMMVRLAFSVAIKAEADIYILDEILAVGDALFQQKCLKVISQIKKRGKTILFVSHDLTSVQKFSDKVVLLDKGEMVYYGNVYRAIKEYERINLSISREEVEEKIEQEAVEVNEHKKKESKDVEIKKITILDSQGKEVEKLSTNRSYKVKIEIKKTSQIDILNVNLGIHSIDYQCIVTGINSLWDEEDINLDKSTILINLPKISLNEGFFFLSSLVFGATMQEVYDVMPYALKFEIVTDKVSNIGVVELEHSWS